MYPRILLALAALALLAAPATAVPITGVGQTFSIGFDGNVEGTDLAGLTAEAHFEVLDLSSSALVLDITLENTTDPALFEGSRVSALGFDVSAPLSGASVASGGLFDHAVLDDAFPNGFGDLDVCVIDNPNNCKGGGGGGVTIGQSGSVVLTLGFGGAPGSLELTGFGVRYQSLDSEHHELAGASGTGSGSELPPVVPEPAATGLLLVAAAALAARARRRA